MRLAHAFCFVTLAALSLVRCPSRAFAAQLTWDAPPGCPDRDAVRWRVEDALGGPLEKAASLRFAAKVEQKSNKRWHVVLDVSNESSDAEPQRRELEAATCDELVQAASIAMALALGADAAGKGAETSATDPPREDDAHLARPEAATSTALIRAAVTPRKAKQPPVYRLAAQVGPVFDYKSLPGISPGIQLSALGVWRDIGLKLGGLVLPQSTTETPAGPGGRFSFMAASAAFCGSTRRRLTELRLCAGSEFGNLRGQGVNTQKSWTGSSGWVAPFVELNGGFRLAEPFRFFVSAAIAAPLIRKDFEILNSPETNRVESIHRPGAVVGRLGVGIEMLWE